MLPNRSLGPKMLLVRGTTSLVTVLIVFPLPVTPSSLPREILHILHTPPWIEQTSI